MSYPLMNEINAKLDELLNRGQKVDELLRENQILKQKISLLEHKIKLILANAEETNA